MDIVKSSKDILQNVEEKVEKGLEVVKDTLSNVVRHLPLANLAKRNDEKYVIEVDLPGVKKEDIEIKVEDGILTVNAVRKFKKELKEDDYYLIESSFGQISRSFILGQDIDPDKIEAEYKNGRLYITLEKLDSKKTKTISVK